jgi:uncharacterized damage-inducible protein DinB
LSALLKGWDTYQQMLVEAVEPLTEAQLAVRAAPHLRPAWTIAAHIITTRVWWVHIIAGEGSADLESMLTWDDDGQPQRSGDELAEGLRRSWALVADCLARWTPADLGVTFKHPRGDEWFTRQWIVWHLIEHDVHHGGELGLTLGMHGIPSLEL